MRIIATITFLFYSLFCQAQNISEYKEIDKFKIKGLTTKVYFNDPIKKLFIKYPDFDSKPNRTKYELLSNFLHNNPLYLFQTSKKKQINKTYILVGNPKKARARNYFNLEIRKSDNSIDKIINKINLGGVFFENMKLFQTPQGKQFIGKGTQIWGYFTMVQPYSQIKSTITELVKQDITNSIAKDIIVQKDKKIEPLFDYQKCGIDNVDERVLTITIYQYDSLGNIKSQYPRTERDNQLYYSSIEKDLISVISFPYFSVTDSKVASKDGIIVNSELDNIKHYLKDVNVIHNSEGQIERIEGKLIIHGYTANGESTNYELYNLEFSDVGNCRLPTFVKLCQLNDKEYKYPRLTVDIRYELNKKVGNKG